MWTAYRRPLFGRRLLFPFKRYQLHTANTHTLTHQYFFECLPHSIVVSVFHFGKSSLTNTFNMWLYAVCCLHVICVRVKFWPTCSATTTLPTIQCNARRGNGGGNGGNDDTQVNGSYTRNIRQHETCIAYILLYMCCIYVHLLFLLEHYKFDQTPDNNLLISFN